LDAKISHYPRLFVSLPLIDLPGMPHVLMCAAADRSAADLIARMEPHAVLDKEAGGRPFLMLDGRRIACSLSHTTGLNVAVVSRRHDVGVDAERADRTVHPSLNERMRNPDDDHPYDAITTWVLKEAVLKATGAGLRGGMRHVRLTVDGARWKGIDFDVLFIDHGPHRIGLAIRTTPS
jgi:phosphopantetheinyl transferase (holo-ACP synthase)